jgi:uncharacterized protein (TIGR02118 family)
MLEVIGTAYRRDDFSPEVFLDNRLTVHAPVAQQAPGLRGHVVSEVDRKLRETFEADAFVEQRFDSEEALQAAPESPEVAAAGADVPDSAKTTGSVRVVREHVIVPPPPKA